MTKAVVPKKEEITFKTKILDQLLKRFEGMSFFIPSLELTKEVVNRLLRRSSFSGHQTLSAPFIFYF